MTELDTFDTYKKGRISVFQELSVREAGVRKVRHCDMYGRLKSMRRRVYNECCRLPEVKIDHNSVT